MPILRRIDRVRQLQEQDQPLGRIGIVADRRLGRLDQFAADLVDHRELLLVFGRPADCAARISACSASSRLRTAAA